MTRIYTTCTACTRVLHIADPQYTTHTNCPQPADELHTHYLRAVETGNEDEARRLESVLNRTPPPPRLGDAAVVYATVYGWPVFPLRPGMKTPATKNGFKDATLDPDQVRRWWQQHPTANIGLPTGTRFDVIDVDAPAGRPSLRAMEDADAVPDVHGVTLTAGGGKHLFVLPTGEGNAVRLLPGIDYRGVGGYIVAPPSVTPHGEYLWLHKPSPVIRVGAK